MAYRNLSMEEAQKRFTELTVDPYADMPALEREAPSPAPAPKPKTAIKRKVVKTIKSDKE